MARSQLPSGAGRGGAAGRRRSVVFGRLTSQLKEHSVSERLGIAGSGAIACGLAAAAARHGEVVLWARSNGSAERARGSVHTICGRLSGEINAAHVRVETDLDALGEATAVVEAVCEDEEI